MLYGISMHVLLLELAVYLPNFHYEKELTMSYSSFTPHLPQHSHGPLETVEKILPELKNVTNLNRMWMIHSSDRTKRLTGPSETLGLSQVIHILLFNKQIPWLKSEATCENIDGEWLLQ